MFGAIHEPIGNATFNVVEERGIPAEPAHDASAEEQPEQQLPAPGVPAIAIAVACETAFVIIQLDAGAAPASAVGQCIQLLGEPLAEPTAYESE